MSNFRLSRIFPLQSEELNLSMFSPIQTIRRLTFVALFGLIITFQERQATALTIDSDDECITYWDDNRPPVIEVFEWTEGKGWRLTTFQFDSDGDWYLDSSKMIIL